MPRPERSAECFDAAEPDRFCNFPYGHSCIRQQVPCPIGSHLCEPCKRRPPRRGCEPSREGTAAEACDFRHADNRLRLVGAHTHSVQERRDASATEVGNGNFENLRLGTIAMRGQNEAARHDIAGLLSLAMGSKRRKGLTGKDQAVESINELVLVAGERNRRNLPRLICAV